jgi:predicted O-methyltransferase YrrM
MMTKQSTSVHFDQPDWLSSRLPSWERFFLPLAGRPLQILEIGSYEGRSACWFAEHLLTDPMSTLTCVDPCDNGEVSEQLRRNLVATGRGERVCLIQGRSCEVLPVLAAGRKHVDIAYIDGSHEAPDVFFDAALSFELLRPDGILLFDDYVWSPRKLDGTPRAPKLAIDVFAKVYAERVECIHRDVQAWFVKRPPPAVDNTAAMHEGGEPLDVERYLGGRFKF